MFVKTREKAKKAPQDVPRVTNESLKMNYVEQYTSQFITLFFEPYKPHLWWAWKAQIILGALIKDLNLD